MSIPSSSNPERTIHPLIAKLIDCFLLPLQIPFRILKVSSTVYGLFPKCAVNKFVPRISFLMRMILLSIFSPLLPYKKNNNQAKKVNKNYSAITDLFFNVQNLIKELIIKLVLSLKGTVIKRYCHAN